MAEFIHKVGWSGDLVGIEATENAIVVYDFTYHANSSEMVASLEASMEALCAIGKGIERVNDPERYLMVAEDYSMKRSRDSKGLPYDEARQAFRSYYAQLQNAAKQRLADEEKAMLAERRGNILAAEKLYKQMQLRALNTDPEKHPAAQT
jgi:hypothetical protein